jgi:hypothetical protein
MLLAVMRTRVTRRVIVKARPVVVGKPERKAPRQSVRYCVYIKMVREELDFVHVIYLA